MSELAEKLIRENLQTKNPVLDLGRCGLDGSEDKLFKILAEARHIQSLILSDYYWTFDAQKEMYVGGKTQNREAQNHLAQIPKYLPKNLKKLSLNGDADYDNIPSKIQDYSPLLELKNLEHLEVDYQENLDLKVISQMTQLRALTCFWQKELKNLPLLANLKQLTFLDISQTNIEDVDFIEKMTSLEHLFLNGNEIARLSVLSNLKQLKTLNIEYNEIVLGLGFLEKLTDLRKLSLKNCEQEEDAEAVRHLKKLRFLDLAYNKLDRIDFLAELTELEELDLSENQLHDLRPLSALKNLKTLDLAFNQVHDFDPLHHLKNLEDLVIRHNEPKISKALDFLWDLTKLKTLDLERSNPANLEDLKKLKNLEELNLSSNNLENINKLSFLTKLKKLRIHYNKIQDISVLKNLRNLEELDISSNPIENIEVLEDLEKLKIFVAWDNKIRSLEPLSHCEALETLRIYKSYAIGKADALQNLVNLKHLTLYSIGLKDISFVSHLKKLTLLNLNGNKIKDISPIADLDKLNFLQLDGNPIQDIRPLKNLPFIFDFKIDHKKLNAPPIWYAYARWERKKFSDYTHLPKLPHIEKIWELIKTEEEENIALAQQLAKGQGWTEEEFEVYRNLL